ncbi:acetyltransferase (isoleucine patch superfamily) [Allocoleopsis franciscana PCC 7113]|uniref:Acetyltransferase (Isoleucine patch superfamily) n=2 Tax=Allocoleopsis TaxID=2886347 RepID=K9WK46_9CYAN|nr:acetyltransferase (isoleucine patch superfamily) [Allocoleopsis franciscana PCC 7113]
MNNLINRIHFDGILYLTNRVVSRIPSHMIRLFFYRYCLGLTIGTNSSIFMDAWFDSKKNFNLGKNSVINQNCRLDNRGSITIGENVSISSEVCILTADHDLQSCDFTGRLRPVNIEDYVFIGTRAMILPGVTLGKGCAVAAGAVVTKSVPPFTIVAGVPAKPIGMRQTNLQYRLSYRRLFY